MRDFVRHRMEVEVECACGHLAALDAREVYGRFSAGGWSTALPSGFLDSPYRHFYCTACRAAGRGKRRPVRIGPVER